MLAVVPRAAADEPPFDFPAKNPSIRVTLPAKWTAGMMMDEYIIVSAPDSANASSGFEVDRTGLADPKAALEKRAQEAAKNVWTGLHDTQLQDRGAHKNANGLDMYGVNLRGKTGQNVDWIISAVRITPAGGKPLIFWFSGPLATAKAHDTEFAAVIESLKSAK